MTINVLGTEYTVSIEKYDEDEAFKRCDIGGYCTALTRSIVVCDMRTYEGLEHEPVEALEAYTKKNLRHEIVHAFFEESGLSDNSSTIEGWASRRRGRYENYKPVKRKVKKLPACQHLR